MSLSFQISWYVFLLAALTGAALSYVVYRYTVPPVPRRLRFLLTALRSSALMLILLALCEPLLTVTRRSSSPAAIAVLADNSLSMSLTDEAGDREKQLRALLTGTGMKQLATALHPVFFSFSSSLREMNPDSLRLNGTTTDIASALASVKRKSPTQLRAVMLLSDGNYNAGDNPLYEAEQFGLPVFSVGIGDSMEQKDIAVEKVLTNSIMYAHSFVSLDATIKAAGFQNRRLTVTLFEDRKQLDQRTLPLPPLTDAGAVEYPIHFSFTPEEEGTKKYTVSVSPLEGEITKKNNAKSVFVKVLKNKMRIVVVAGAPGADVSAVMQSLRADPNVESALFVQQPSGLFRNRPLQQSLREMLPSMDCVAFVGFPVATTSSATLQFLSEALSSRSLPLLFIAGRALSLQKLKLMDPYLPFTTASDNIEEQVVFPHILPANQYHVLVQSTKNQMPAPPESPADWNMLPPVFSSLGTFKAKPGGLVLSTTKVQNVVIDNPLLIARSVAGAKSFAVTAYGIWRWRLLAAAGVETENFFDAWISNVVRWLVTREENKELQVVPSKEIFSQGETVDFLGQSYNANYQPVDNADIKVEMTSSTSSQRYETILQPLERGRYEGTIEGLPEGDYSFKAMARRDDQVIGMTHGRFSVGEQSVEFADTRMNKPLLQQIAALSGGSYTDAAQFEQMAQKIVSRFSTKPEEQISTSEFELWNLPAILSVIVALFGLEWLIRKRSGML